MDRYVNNRTPLQVTHTVCGSTYKVRPKDFLNGTRCRECFIKGQRRTKEEYRSDFNKIMGKNFELLTEYAGSKKKVKVRHVPCGHEYEVRSGNLYDNSIGCRKCATINNTKTDEDYRKEVQKIHGDSYTVLDVYVNKHTELRTKHNECGHVFKTPPERVLRGSGCPKCFGTRTRTHQQFLESVKHRLTEYDIVGEYVNRRTKIEVNHKVCGYTWKILPPNFEKGNSCPYCTTTSKGERILIGILEEADIPFEHQKTFTDLRHKYPLSIDFYLPEHNTLIEYQGRQHYMPFTDSISSREKYREQVMRDTLKIIYARDNKINLVAIPYIYDTAESIAEYLKKYIPELKELLSSVT